MEIIPYLPKKNVRTKWNVIVDEHLSLLKLEENENRRCEHKLKQALITKERGFKPKYKEKNQLNIMHSAGVGNSNRNMENHGGPTNIINVGVSANYHYHPTIMNFQCSSFNPSQPQLFSLKLPNPNQINPLSYQSTYFTFNQYTNPTNFSQSLMRSNNAGNSN